jgi:hypothetical protein
VVGGGCFVCARRVKKGYYSNLSVYVVVVGFDIILGDTEPITLWAHQSLQPSYSVDSMDIEAAASDRKWPKKPRLDAASIVVQRLNQVKGSNDLALVLERMKTLLEYLNMHNEDTNMTKIVISCRILDLVVEIMGSFNDSWRVAYFGCDILSTVLCDAIKHSKTGSCTENLLTSSDIQDAGVPIAAVNALSTFENNYDVVSEAFELFLSMLWYHCRFPTSFSFERRIVTAMSNFSGTELPLGDKACEVIHKLCECNSREVQIFTELGVCPLVFHALIDFSNDNEIKSDTNIESDKIGIILRALDTLLRYGSRAICQQNRDSFHTMGIRGVLQDLSESSVRSDGVRLLSCSIINTYFTER